MLHTGAPDLIEKQANQFLSESGSLIPDSYFNTILSCRLSEDQEVGGAVADLQLFCSWAASCNRPEFVLENMKNLKSHDKGHTFEVITRTLQKELGYHIDYSIIDGRHWVPQHRERIVIVGFREPTLFSLDTIKMPEAGKMKIGDILHKTDGSEPYIEHDESRYFDHEQNCIQSKYTLTFFPAEIPLPDQG